ncbi:conjugal transfer protein TraB [Streptomyces sp. NPDC101115]|uniref:conjugal transfer protein TraB n=1 Tax=Streptomyces sp. NPDC101115 TaxID=3366106 RepID=UPI0037F9C6A1
MSDELVYTAPDLPERSGDGETPSFLRLNGRLTALALSAMRLTEGLHKLRRQMEHDADDADRLAEMCRQAEVEPQFLALIHEASGALRAVATASGEMAGAADDLTAATENLADAHDREYRGVFETVQASGVQQAKPGFYRTR